MIPMKISYIFLSNDKSIVDELNKASSEVTPEKFSSANNVLELLGLVLLLIIILVAAYYTSRFVGRYKLGQLKDSNIRIIEAYKISTNKMLQIIKICDKYVVLAVSKDNITFITELDESQVLTHDINEGEKQSFRQIFDKIRGKKE